MTTVSPHNQEIAFPPDMEMYWDFLEVEIAPWTHLWRKANYYYAHDQQFWAITNKIMVGLAIVVGLLLGWLVKCIQRKFTQITTLESEQQLMLVLQAIDEHRKVLQGINEVLKKPATEAREQPGMYRASFGPEKRGLANGQVLMEHSEVTG